MDNEPSSLEQPGLTSRRAVVTALGAGAIGLGVAACGAQADDQKPDRQNHDGQAALPAQAPDCVLAPEAIEGPYYIDRDLVRSNLVEDREGVPLSLRLTVLDVRACRPLEGVAVDIWHCDAHGQYSGHLDLDPNEQPMPDPHVEPTDPSTFLRGTQITDRRGAAEFRTIYPSWYFGRAVHIHAMLHAGGKLVHTGQLYFPEDITARIMERSPYSDRPPQAQRTTNDQDFLYEQEGGRLSTLRIEPEGNGYSASMALGVDPTKTPPQPQMPAPPR